MFSLPSDPFLGGHVTGNQHIIYFGPTCIYNVLFTLQKITITPTLSTILLIVLCHIHMIECVHRSSKDPRVVSQCLLLKTNMLAGALEGSEQTEHWRGKPLFTNNGLPLQCVVSSEPSGAPA